MIKTVEDMIIRFCPHRIEFKDSDGFTHGWCSLITALKLEYKKSIYLSTDKTLAILEKGWNPRLPYDTLKKDFIDIHTTAKGFKIILDKERHCENRCMQNSFTYAKERGDKNLKPPDFKVGDLVLVSTINFNNIKGPKKLKEFFSGSFIIRELHGPSSMQLELKSKLMNKQPTFPLSLIKPYSSSDKELFFLRNIPLL
ncbi:hypothetical protein O181_015435 [Austropuccinia psidii MF-1]|uniref:Uncharacterized protein n=1 Tax=Austropuccinia psidii MF-1 TaxID=1389203 RepID=A0A9Q3GQY4_9BASI|nr:hypothetical protein [Austropuccinia psidii MF-1]